MVKFRFVKHARDRVKRSFTPLSTVEPCHRVSIAIDFNSQSLSHRQSKAIYYGSKDDFAASFSISGSGIEVHLRAKAIHPRLIDRGLIAILTLMKYRYIVQSY